MYWALVGVTALSSIVAPGTGFEATYSATGGCGVVTVTTLLYSEYNSSMSPNRRRCHFGGIFIPGGTGGIHHENIPCGRRYEYGVGMTASASWWKPLSFWSNHKYWYLNSYPIILWSCFFIVNPKAIPFQIWLLWILYWLLCFACLSRCDRFGVACGTMGGLPDNLWWHQRLRGRYYDVTVLSVYKSSMSLRRRGCCFGGVFAAGCTWDCHSYNFQCGR